jgi:hypothetical protein
MSDRASLHAINVAVRKVKKDLGDRVFSGDIGCYSLGAYHPFKGDDTLFVWRRFWYRIGLARGQSGPVIGTWAIQPSSIPVLQL